MLVIRLARTGKKKQAFFRVVVAEKQRAVGAKFIEILGNYNPHNKKLEIINIETLQKYLENGASPSNTLAKLLKKEGIKMPKWVAIASKNRPAKKKEEKPEAPAAKKADETPEVVEEPATVETENIKEDVTEKETETEEIPVEDIKEPQAGETEQKDEETKETLAESEETKTEELKE